MLGVLNQLPRAWWPLPAVPVPSHKPTGSEFVAGKDLTSGGSLLLCIPGGILQMVLPNAPLSAGDRRRSQNSIDRLIVWGESLVHGLSLRAFV